MKIAFSPLLLETISNQVKYNTQELLWLFFATPYKPWKETPAFRVEYIYISVKRAKLARSE